ncbi:MAG: 4-hydroxythreonine-4-phosphate dehydrogenase PdxA [Pseudomonadota bacterium]
MLSVRPRLLVNVGEPAGIGPDICLAIAKRQAATAVALVADPAVLAARAATLGEPAPDFRILDWQQPFASDAEPGVAVLPITFPSPDSLGVPDPANASTLLDGLRRANELVRRGAADALVTAPVQKSAILDAGIAFSGHTEYLAELNAATRPVMMLVSGGLRVALATTHLPLRAVPDAITEQSLATVIDVLQSDLGRRYGLERPRIAVCGLNPHAGEGGHLGHEDDRIIAPAIAAAQSRGIDAFGPVPADTAFTPAVGHIDVVLAMYHDQGLPVIKHAGFGSAVNVTLGLPVIRTSVDHGTALTLAGTGDADPASLFAAMDEAAKLVLHAR